MFGRREFGILGLSAAALATLEATGFAADTHAHGDSDECAEACSDCQQACDSCAHHCALMLAEGKKEHLATLQTCQDCADFCSAAAQIVSRGGPFADLICTGCADACARCAKECEQHVGDKHMAKCAKECRECEVACRVMLKK